MSKVVMKLCFWLESCYCS